MKKTVAHIARLGIGLWLAAAAGSALAKNDSYDLVGDGTGRDLSVAANGTITSELKGHSTLLGNFTGVVVHTFKNAKEFEGSGYFRALNGDLLRFTHKGKLETNNELPMDLKGTLTMTGGTGAFDAASGKVKFSGQNFGAGIVQYSFDGTITFDDSPREEPEDAWTVFLRPGVRR